MEKTLLRGGIYYVPVEGATKRLGKSDFKGIQALREEGLIKKYLIVSRDPVDSVRNDTTCLHWKSFIGKLWADALI
jgi:hypothetical protein